MFAVAISFLPSPLKSPAVIDIGPNGAENFVKAPKVPSPFPSRTATNAGWQQSLKFVTDRPIFESPFKSAAVIACKSNPPLQLFTAPKPPFPTLEEAEPIPTLLFAAAISGLVSPLKSAATREGGLTPLMVAVVGKLPEPLPNNTGMGLLPSLPVARSSLPSVLKSAVTIDSGFVPTVKLVGEAKPACPFPTKRETEVEKSRVITRSSFPSLVKSARASALGRIPLASVPDTEKLPKPSPINTVALSSN